MNKDVNSVLIFERYVIEKIEWYINKEFKETEEGIALDLNFSNDFAFIEEKYATVSLECKVFDKAEEHNKPFNINVIITGYFRFEGEVSSDTQKKFLEVNATAILFPYLRALISSITCNAGLNPLILPLFNIGNFVQNSKVSQE